jgi:segregation and condensation protein B
MEDHEIKPILEALLFISAEPIPIDRLKEILAGVAKNIVFEKLSLLQQEYAQSDRGMQIVEVAGGYQMTTRAEMAPWIRDLEKIKTSSRLSQPSLETLAIIAYKQPLTRAEIEAIRGVDGAGVLKTLMDRRLIKIVGRKEVAGRPLIYGTTREFLLYFGLANLTALPTLKEFTEIAERSAEPDITWDRVDEEFLQTVGVNNHSEEPIS